MKVLHITVILASLLLTEIIGPYHTLKLGFKTCLSQFVIIGMLCLQMAGEIFTNLDNLFNVDCANVHPLVCHMCHEQYRSPCLLDCYHIFCARCLRGRINDNRLSCPLCG